MPEFVDGMPMEWMPIETAPKDGTRLLLGWAGESPVIGFWGRKNSRYGVNYGDAWGIGYSWNEQFAEPPTHWMPLPPAPEVTK